MIEAYLLTFAGMLAIAVAGMVAETAARRRRNAR